MSESKKNRTFKHNKRVSMKKKSKVKLDKQWNEYDNFMISNQIKQKNHRESPHIVIHRSLRDIEDHTIFLKCAVVKNEGMISRTINYKIDKCGSGVSIRSKQNDKYMNIHLQRCSRNKIFIVVALKSVCNLPGVVLFDEDCKRMNTQQAQRMNKAYVLLAIAEKVQESQEFGIHFSTDDIKTCEKFWNNQIKPDGSFHFRTSGKIFSLGYGPKYQIDNNLSIAEFAQKKRKFTDDQITGRDDLKKKMFHFLHCTVSHIFSSIHNLQHAISPHVAILQNHFDLVDKTQEDQFNLQKKGILNVHICHNAQTEMKHTECDASYTIISVPDQGTKKSKDGKQNLAKFEFNLDEKKALVVPLEINTILIYSGYLLTHRQQMYKLNENFNPFINVVSYNSEKLFKHLMESFRREINETSKPK